MSKPSIDPAESDYPWSYNSVSLSCPNAVQPHGVLLVLQEPSLNLVQISANSHVHLGVPPGDLLGQSLRSWLPASAWDNLQTHLESLNPLTDAPLSLKLSCRFPAQSPLQPSPTLQISEKQPESRFFDALVHRTAAGVILELVPTEVVDGDLGLRLHGLMRGTIAQMQQAAGFDRLLNLAVERLKALTGFDRVMIYQFEAQGSGCVIAEAKRSDLSPYLGLHFPTTDIPEEVRQFYRRCLVRWIPDVAAPAVALCPGLNPIVQAPLDLSFALLRSVDPCFVTYLQNMGVAATLVISLVHQQGLWGLIACHHYSPRQLPMEVRTTCELLGQVLASELVNQTHQANLTYQMSLQSCRNSLVTVLSQANTLRQALLPLDNRLLEVVGATGIAICLDQEIFCLGSTPDQGQIKAFLNWLETQGSPMLFHTHALSQAYPPGTDFQTQASGILVLQISKQQPYTLLWFRPEVIQTLNWAGNPNEQVFQPGKKDLEQSLGQIGLNPRTSFEQWQETVRGTALPWQESEIENALELRNAIVGIVLTKADELAQINQELERSNQELSAFAYAASHDLKEPLRGIYNYSTFLLEDYEGMLDEAGVDRLQTLINLSQRMETLIDILLKFSQLGQTELHIRSTDLNGLLDRVLQVFQASRQDLQFQVRLPRPLPQIRCDPVLTNELFTNLISNALKYNDRAEKWVEIGFLTPEEYQALPPEFRSDLEPTCRTPWIFYVKDNGIGIRDRHLDTIFRLFKRLHAQNKYGGGTGAGLTIARKIVERHQGQIWVRSTYGQGSTFYFCFGLSEGGRS